MALRVDGVGSSETVRRRLPSARFIAACVPAVLAVAVAIAVGWEASGTNSDSHQRVLWLWTAYALVAGGLFVFVGAWSPRVWQTFSLLVSTIAAGYWLAIDFALSSPLGPTGSSGPPTAHPSESVAQTLQYVGLGMCVLFALVILAFVVLHRAGAPHLGWIVLSLSMLATGWAAMLFDQREILAMFSGRPHLASMSLGNFLLGGVLIAVSQVPALIGLCMAVRRRSIVWSVVGATLLLPTLGLVFLWVDLSRI